MPVTRAVCCVPKTQVGGRVDASPAMSLTARHGQVPLVFMAVRGLDDRVDIERQDV